MTSEEGPSKDAAEAGGSGDAFCERWTKRRRYFRRLSLFLALILELACFFGVHVFYLPLRMRLSSHQWKPNTVGDSSAELALAPLVAPPSVARTRGSTVSEPLAVRHDNAPEEGEEDPDPAAARGNPCR